MRSECPRAFWPISQKLDFCKIWDLCNNKVHNKNLYIIDHIQKKLMPFQHIKKTSEKNYQKTCPCQTQVRMGF